LADELNDVVFPSHHPPKDLFEDEPFESMDPEATMPESDYYTTESFKE
jgi:hypothetical protein